MVFRRRRFALFAVALLIGCTSTPPAKEPAPPDPFESIVSRMKAGIERGKTEDPGAVLAALKRLAPQDPDALLSAFTGTDLILENLQDQLSRKDLERLGEPPGPFRDLPILQRVFLDGGNGIFMLVHLHRLRSVGGFRINPKDAFQERMGGDVIAMVSRLLEARFLHHHEAFHLERALARLRSPDWRVNLSAENALLGESLHESANLRRYALELLNRSAGDELRTRTILITLGVESPEPADLRDHALNLGGRIVQTFHAWFREKGKEEAWISLLDDLFRLVSDPTHPLVERLHGLGAALCICGHGSRLPGLTRAALNTGGKRGAKGPEEVLALIPPRSYVKAFSPRLQACFMSMLSKGGEEAFLAVLGLLSGADPYLKVWFSENRKDRLEAALLGGLVEAPPRLRLLGIMALEELSGCTFHHFDPFSDEPERKTALKEMVSRFERTRFQGLKEELERKCRLRSVRKALDTVAFLQRRYHAECGSFCPDVDSLFGEPALVKAAGFKRSGTGRWTLRYGFRFEMEVDSGGFEARALGKMGETDRETTFRIRQDVAMMEILPD